MEPQAAGKNDRRAITAVFHPNRRIAERPFPNFLYQDSFLLPRHLLKDWSVTT
ncbi:hypothetical protein [Sphingomonas aquatica]|uniref:hypothetical protein n=1 Tax=Sphingomonas aquatica TaxID=1763824 RepID=UPI001454D201